ncbi:hypothetical protein B1H19_02620 [Streptomyces gilvosporeus]|uniref:DUF4175 domain-containing protein n=1 Tax=Streptomyces gilvosporeus TaxID=553510 RepID=A0A1V0TK08_9ACTN|nr:hypothetical protein B1H19_02620 [Streptomyces gilvosporeus]
MAARFTLGVDPIRTVMFWLLAPSLLIAGALGGMGWPWWVRVLSAAGGLLMSGYLVLLLVGAWRRMRRHTRPGPRKP